MLNLQQTKVLSALINNYGITDHYDLGILGSQAYMLDDIIDQIEMAIGMEITIDTAMQVESDGTVTPQTVYRLSYDQRVDAEHYYLQSIERFLKEGISLDHLQ